VEYQERFQGARLGFFRSADILIRDGSEFGEKADRNVGAPNAWPELRFGVYFCWFLPEAQKTGMLGETRFGPIPGMTWIQPRALYIT
jgi:hypothetical protein